MFEQVVEDNLLVAGKEERSPAIAQAIFHDGVPAITVVVDGGWSKCCHKHSYKDKSDVRMIFRASTKKVVFIGMRKNTTQFVSLVIVTTHHIHHISILRTGMGLLVLWKVVS